MKYFFIYTRGRTGSTAICDEIDSHPSVICHQELFMPDAWKLGGMHEAFLSLGNEIFKSKGTSYKVMPFSLYIRQYTEVIKGGRQLFETEGNFKTRSEVLDDYFDYFEGQWVTPEITHVGFKILEQHFIEWPELWHVLRQRGYESLYLSRDTVRQVLSGLIAEHRGGGGAYNEQNGEGFSGSVRIDIDDFKKKVNYEEFSIKLERMNLHKYKIKNLDITYEGFVNYRDNFYNTIFEFLGCKSFSLEQSNYTVQIQRKLSDIVENYRAFKKVALKLGSRIEYL